jgi:ATP-dependent helicase/nuclease subunit A
VGDPKQSIYSFQGADPRWFEDSRQHWRKRSHAAELVFHDVTLDLSFRSAPALLKAVDATFRDPGHFRGLSFDDKAVGTSHESARTHAPGHVEVWSTEFGDPEAAEPDAWTIPVDQPEPSSPSVMVAERVAAAVRAWTRTGDEAGRVWRPRDVMILVRKRNAAFFALIRALKGAGVPVAGADRFDINEHIAVNDLVAAGQCAVLPDGDLVLATALKSPLVGLDDDDLIRIAADRAEGETLAAALARMADEGDAGARAGHVALTRWRALARMHGPFGFYAALLGPGGGRRQLIERLGSEAADAIDAFLGYAEAAEGGPETPSLVTFLARFEGSEHTIKRDLDSSGDEVKVMTVHGAKGLEAAIVVVVDGCDVGDDRSVLIPLPTREAEAPLVVWSSGKTSDSGPIAEWRSLMAERACEEHNRLLYVAMTRAKDRLVLAPFGGAKGEPESAWCAMVRRSLQGDPRATMRAHERGEVLVWSDGQDGAAAAETSSPAMASIDVPAWLTEAAPREPEPSRPLRPSGGPTALATGRARPGAGRRRVGVGSWFTPSSSTWRGMPRRSGPRPPNAS